ncbi:MAG: response regulator [Rhodospirillales bacterium]|nr:response regulator [Rhodospirillales bacterium]
MRVLVVEDNPTDRMILEDAFADLQDCTFELTRASRLSEAIRYVEVAGFDTILLDLGLPDSQGVETFQKLYEYASDTPILVLTGLDDELAGIEAMRGGAEDYLLKREMRSPVLGRAIRYAIERNLARNLQENARRQEEQEREVRGIEHIARQGTAIAEPGTCDGVPIKDAYPEDFNLIVEHYGHLLDESLDTRAIKTENWRENIHALCGQLAGLRAGPRDIIEVHAAAIGGKMSGVTIEKAQAYLEEGRLTLLELMGRLVSFYRKSYDGPRSGSVRLAQSKRVR